MKRQFVDDPPLLILVFNNQTNESHQTSQMSQKYVDSNFFLTNKLQIGHLIQTTIFFWSNLVIQNIIIVCRIDSLKYFNHLNDVWMLHSTILDTKVTLVKYPKLLNWKFQSIKIF